jgi:hypothetical protein
MTGPTVPRFRGRDGLEPAYPEVGDGRPLIIAETLRHAPPVRATRRVVPVTGTVVVIHLAASGLPFGAGPHQCPGRDHAVAIAAGILESVRGCRLVGGTTGLRALRCPAGTGGAGDHAMTDP